MTRDFGTLIRWALALTAAAAGAYFLYLLVAYGSLDGYLDHMEPNVAVPSWLFLHDRPIYRPPDALPPDLFTSTYGPLIYVVNAGFFAVLGGSIATSKLASLLAAACAALIFLAFVVRRHGWPWAGAGMAVFLGLMMIAAPMSIWNRPDGFLVLLVAVAVLAKTWRRQVLADVVIGVALGLAVNFKAHAFVYFLPLMIDHAPGRLVSAFLRIAGVSVAVFLVPFALPGVSLTAYVRGLFVHVAARGYDPELAISALKYSTLYLSPGLVLVLAAMAGRGRVGQADVIYVLAVAASAALLLFPASREGAGNQNLVPLIPLASEMAVRFMARLPERGALAKAVMVIYPLMFLMIAIPPQRRLARVFEAVAGNAVGAELRAIAREFDGSTVEMGYGGDFETYRKTFYRPILVFAGNGYTLEAMTVMENRETGIPIPRHIVERVGSCAVDYWLIPRGEEPFRMGSYYGGGDLFGEAFRRAFRSAYEKRSSRTHFDVWGCRQGKG